MSSKNKLHNLREATEKNRSLILSFLPKPKYRTTNNSHY